MTEMDVHLSLVRNHLWLSQIRVRSMDFNLKSDKRPEYISAVPHIIEGYRRVHRRAAGLARDENASEEVQVYIFRYQVAIRAVSEEPDADEDAEDSEPTFEVRADYDVEYYSKIELPDAGLKEFSKDNVGYHVWPYWRELVSSSLSRAGIPTDVIQVPLYNVGGVLSRADT